MTASKSKSNRKFFKTLIIFAVPVVLIGVLAVVWAQMKKQDAGGTDTITFTVKRGPLVISVTESGNIKAKETVDILCQVEGRTTIISVVPEGTVLTEEDVKNEKVLIELDSSQLTEQKNQQEIQVTNADASLTDAKESKNIQVKQNESDISAGELKVKFALMDLQKYLGQTAADQFIATVDQNQGESLDFSVVWADPNQPAIGGEALQKWRDLQSSIELADEQLKRAKDKYDWTEKLYAKKYISRTDLEADRLAQRQREIDIEQSQTAIYLYKRYEFPKQVEQLWSDYIESQRELDRIQAKALSMITQANAKLTNAQLQYDLQTKQNEKLAKQIAGCIIKAPTPGLVVYGSSGDFFRRQSQQIEAGAQVYERQKLLTIPNTSGMKVETKVHETSVNKVYAGLPARITVEALPDKAYTGKVTKVSPLPDSQRGFLTPDLKVYNTDVSINELDTSLRSEMSAKVEIIIESFEDVLYVPVQAIVNREGTKFCFVQSSNDLEERQVKAGAFNENFIVIYEGLKEGEKVSLKPPRTASNLESKPQPLPEGISKPKGPKDQSSETDRPGGAGTGGRRERPGGRGQGRPGQGGPGQGPGPSAQGPGGRQMPGGMNMDMIKKLQDPEVQKKLKKAADEGRLAEELKNQGIEVPAEMIKNMEQMIKQGGGRPGGGPGGRGGNRSGGRSGGGPGQRPEGGRGNRPNQ
jgi:HlyD family secretion protein